MPKLTISVFLLVVGLVSCASANLSAQACDAHLPTHSSDWPVYGGQYEGDHYSSLSQINRDNVRQLKLAWTFDGGEEGGLETSPIVVGNILYAYTASQKVIALDAATGKLIWKFDSGVRSSQPTRGLAYWTDGKQPRILAGVMNFLYALDALTGKPILSFGEQGRIDLRKNLRGDYESQSIALTSPGVVYQDLIIVGGRNPETYPSPPGDVRAFDVRTGALRWSFHTIPHPGEAGYETWPQDAWKTAGAANNWAGMVLDEKRGIVYVPTGSPVFDFYGADRIGDDLFADSLIALDAKTGKRLWHFQGVHHDVWDRDFPSPPVLLSVKHNGKCVEAVAQTTKQGYLYLFNRVTGEPLFPVLEKPYPPSQVPGEVTSPTQPVPSLPAPFTRQILSADMLTQRSSSAHDWAVKEFSTFESQGQFLPIGLNKETVVFPCFLGGAEWGGPAVDPRRGVIYVNANEMACVLALTENKPSSSTGERIYHNQCSVCHGNDLAGSPPVNPSLLGVGDRLTASQIQSKISEGSRRMPSFPNLSGDHLQALINFLLKPAASTNPTPKTAAQSQPESSSAATLYRSKCAGCHGIDGSGIPKLVPSLQAVDQHFTPDQLRERVHIGKGKMPAFPEIVGSDFDNLLHYIRTLSAPVVSDPDEGGIYSSAPDGTNMKYEVTGSRDFIDPDGYPAITPPWGTLNAIDLNTGKYLWKIPLGEYPQLTKQGITNTGSENYGGPVVTSGGVLFIGATVYDKKFRAFDSHTGELLWETTLPFAGVATPATYAVDGKQFVVIASGGGKDSRAASGSVYVAFALP
jgi:glucose dehydrogenase